MTELSLHILDIVNNSTKAGATVVEIGIAESVKDNHITITIADNGCGMDADFLSQVTDPFKTTRTTRKVGMGLSLFKEAANLTGGGFDIKSEVGKGTVVTASFVRDSIDRQPLGDMASTMVTLIGGSPATDFVYTHTFDGEEFVLSTKEVRSILGDVDITSAEVLAWISGYIKEGLDEMYK